MSDPILSMIRYCRVHCTDCWAFKSIWCPWYYTRTVTEHQSSSCYMPLNYITFKISFSDPKFDLWILWILVTDILNVIEYLTLKFKFPFVYLRVTSLWLVLLGYFCVYLPCAYHSLVTIWNILMKLHDYKTMRRT